jgi:hypothetical protein
MKTVLRRILLVALVVISSFGLAQAQTTIFSENLGTPAATTTIAAYTGWQNNGVLTFSNGGSTSSADVRISSASSTYTGASGGGNVFFTATSGTYGFSIEGINAAAYTSLSLSYGYRKESGTVLATFSVDYWNGTAWVTLANTAGTLFNEAANAATGWYAAKAQALPSGAQINGLKIRFVKSGTASIRIDDIKLVGTIPACAAPSTQLSIGTLASTTASMTIPVTAGNGDSRLVQFNTSAPSLAPADGTSYSAATAYATAGTEQTVMAGAGSSVTVTGLTANTTYYYQAWEYNACSGSPKYNTTSAPSGNFTTLSNAPTVGTGSNATSSSFDAAWSAPAAQGSATYTYEIQVDDDPLFGSVDFTQSAIASSTTSLNVNTGLSANTAYYYRVRATNTAGSSAWSSNSAAVTTLPGSPSIANPTATSITDVSAILGGNITSNGGGTITDYGTVYALSSAAVNSTSNNASAGTSNITGTFSHTRSGLSPETQYYYAAYVTNAAGTALSSIGSFYTLSAAPAAQAAIFTATPVSFSQIDLSFSAASTISNADGYLVLMNYGSAPTGTPSVANAYSVGSVIGGDTVVAVINSTSTTSFSVTGLAPNANYYFTLIPFNSDAVNNVTYNYNTTSPASANASTLSTSAAIAINSSNVTSATINQNTTNNLIYAGNLQVSNLSSTLNTVNLSLAGTYSASDLTNVKVWYATASTFNAGTATLLGTATSNYNAIAITGLNQALSIGTHYFYVTADLACLATVANTVSVNAVDTASFTFASGSKSVASVAAGNTFTIGASAASPNAATTFTGVGNGTNGQIGLSWVAPTGCYNEVMVIAMPAVFSGTAPSGNGSSYTANTTYGSGSAVANGWVVYKGTGTAVTATGFTNGTIYYFRIYTRYNNTWVAGTDISNVVSYKNVTVTDNIMPLYMPTGIGANRVPFACNLTLSGLSPNTTYRYINQVVAPATEGATSTGAGNPIFVGANQAANFVGTSSPSLSSVYGSLTTDATGSYTGWFMNEATANAARFTAGTQVKIRIRLNDGASGTLNDALATSNSAVTVLTLSTSAGVNNATAIRSTSSANARDFVCLYDNTAGTGRPLAAAYIESDGYANTASYAAFYSGSVEAVAGAWGTIIPNNNANGVRRIETRSFATGSLICSTTSANGTWPTGSINTVNPLGGTTAIVIANADAALNCSDVVLSHSNLAQSANALMSINSNDNILANFTSTVATFPTTLNSLSFTIGGTFNAGDVTNFKLYTSTSNLFPGGTALATVAATSIANSNTVSFTGLSQALAVGTRYFWIAADFGATGTGNTVIVPALATADFTFNSNATVSANTISIGGTMTLGVPVPTMNITAGTASTANLNDGTTNNVVYSTTVNVGVTNAILNSATFTTAGTYTASDLTNIKLWYSSLASFNSASSTLLGTLTTGLGAGAQSFNSLSQSMAVGNAYLYLTVDVPCGATLSSTISVNAIDSSNLTFASGTPSGAGSIGGVQTITASNPTDANAINATATGTSGQASVAFTLPSGCYDEVMIVVAPASNTGTPSGNGSAYTANATYSNGTALGNGYVIYKGTTSPQLVNGLTNGTTYYVKLFTRRGTTWSAGTTDVTVTPIATPAVNEVIFPQYAVNGATSGSRLQYVCRLQLINLTPNATYRYVTGASLANNFSSSVGGTAGTMYVINNTSGANGYIVGHTSSKSLSGALVSGNNFAAAAGYGEFTTDANGVYEGWFASSTTGNPTFTAGNAIYFYLGLNNGAGGTTQATIVHSNSTISMLTEASATNGAKAVKGSSNATPENMIFLYDNIAGTGRPLYGTWSEDDGLAQTYTTWYNTNVGSTSGNWGAYVPSNLANGIRRIEQRDVQTAALVNCPALSTNGTWTGAGNTVNPTFGTTPLVFSSTDSYFGLPSLTLGTNPSVAVNTTSSSISYSALVGAPNQYRIDWDASANTAGFVDVSATALAAGSIALSNIPTGIAGTYNANLYVKDSNKVCESNAIPFSLTLVAPSATVSGADTIFVGDSTSITIAFTGVGPWNYTLSDGNTYSSNTSIDTVTVIPSSSQVYTVVSLTDNGNVFTTTNSADLTGGANILVVALNDTCSAAQSLTVTASCTYTAGSSLNGHPSASSASCGNSDDDVWYSFIKPAGMTTITVSVLGGTNYNPAFEILNSCGGSVINCTNNSNSTNNSTETSNVTFSAAQGTYFMRVFDARVGAGSGNFSVCLVGNIPAPQNDDPCGSSNFSGNSAKWGGASTILASYDGGSPIFMGQANNAQSNPPTGVNLVYFSGSTAYANNLGANEPTPPCGNLGSNAKTVWFKFKAPSIGGVDVNLRTLFNGNPTNFATNIAAYALSVDPCTNTPSFTNLGCATTGVLNLTAASTILTPYAGQFIYVQLAGNGASSPVGNYMLSIQAVPQNIALSNPTTSSLTVTLPTAPGATNVSVQWRAVGSNGYSIANISPSLGTYTISGLNSGVNYQVWAKYYNNSQAFYTNFATMGTVIGCSAAPAAPSVVPVPNRCSRDTIEWAAHPLASGAFPYRLYWKQASSTGGYSVLAIPAAAYNNATGKVSVLLTNLLVNTSYQFYYRVMCAGGAQVASNVATYTQCNGPAKMDGTFHGSFEHNGRYFVDADFIDVTNFTDNTPADGNVHEVVLNEVNDMNAVLNGSNVIVASNGEENGAFELIPNPTSDNVFVEYNLANAGRVVVRVMNIQGKVVKEEVMENSDASGAVQIDLSDVQSGVYMVSVDAPGYKATKRLVVTK